MATMNVSLPDTMKDWVEARLEHGDFSNTSDYVRHLIRQDQERTDARLLLQKAIEEGISSGAAEPFDFKAFKTRMHQQHGSK